MILAQAAQAGGQGTGPSGLFDYLVKFQFPTRADFVSGLESLPTLYAVGLTLAGIVFLLYGFKWFKALVVIDGAAIGAMAGASLGSLRASPNMPLLLGLGGAVLLGILAYPTVRYAVGLMSALAGGVIGYGLWHFAANAVGRPDALQHAWAGGVIGMIAVGMLTFIAFRPAVMIFTSLQGALMIIAGICSLLLNRGDMGETVRPELVNNNFLLIVLAAVPALAGFTVQFSREAAVIRKKRKQTEKPPV